MRVAGASILAAVLVAVLSTGCKSGMAPEECTGTCIVVENRSASQTIEFVNFSSCSDQSWGSDRLTGSLDPGEQRAWSVEPGCWDIRAGWESGGTTCSSSASGVDITSGQTYVLTFNGCP